MAACIMRSCYNSSMKSNDHRNNSQAKYPMMLEGSFKDIPLHAKDLSSSQNGYHPFYTSSSLK